VAEPGQGHLHPAEAHQSQDGRQTPVAERRRADGHPDLEGHPGWNAWDAWAGVHRRDLLAGGGYTRHRHADRLALVRHLGAHGQKWGVHAGWNRVPVGHWKAQRLAEEREEAAAEPNRQAAALSAA
jgi:hypothetical protein